MKQKLKQKLRIIGSLLLIICMTATAIPVQAAGPIMGTMTIGGKTVSQMGTNDNGDGWNWIADTATLELNENYDRSLPISINCTNMVLPTINLVYSGNVSIASSTASAIRCNTNLVINRAGSVGTLSLEYTGTDNLPCALEIYGILQIESGTVNAVSWSITDTYAAAAVYVTKGVVVTGDSSLTVEPKGENACGILIESGKLELSTTGTVSAKGNGTGSALSLWGHAELIISGTELLLTGTPLHIDNFTDVSISSGTISINGTPVFLTALTLPGISTPTTVTSVNSTASVHGIASARTSGEGKLFLLLPEGSCDITITTSESRTYTGTVSVTNDHSAAGALTTPIVINTTSLPDGTVDTLYHAQLTASGTAPLTWSLYYGILPEGFSITPDGIITGTTGVAYTYNFTVKAENAQGSYTQQLSLKVNEGGGSQPIPNPDNGSSATPGSNTGTKDAPVYQVDGNTAVWETVGKGIKESNASKIAVKMSGTGIVPGAVLETIAGKETVVVFDLGNGIMWEISGSNLKAAQDSGQVTNWKDLNLKTVTGAGQIPSAVLEDFSKRLGQENAQAIT